MKNISLLFLFYFQTFKVFCQPYPTPSIEFEGTKMSWKYMLKDPYSLHESVGVIYLDEFAQINNPPLEYNNNIIYNLGIGGGISFGNVITSIDNKSGLQNWTTYYNPILNNGYGYNFYVNMQNTGNHELLLTGIKSAYNNLPAPVPINNFIGYFAQRTLDTQTGQEISSYENIKNPLYYGILSSRIQQINDQGYHVFYEGFYPSDIYDYSFVLSPSYFYPDRDSLVSHYLPSDTMQHIRFYTREPNGQVNPVNVKGPFYSIPTEYSYLVEHVLNGEQKHFIFKVDAYGNVVSFKDISTTINGPSGKTLWSETIQMGENILIIVKQFDGTYEGYRGYILLDLEGNIVREKRTITIEAKKAGHINSLALKGTNDMLHVIRFQGEKNLVFYKEDNQGDFTKVGELINPNPPIYTPIPLYTIQTSDHGIVISGQFVMDSVTSVGNFNAGGWPFLFKIEAKELDIATNTKYVSQLDKSPYTISPNPAYTSITIAVQHKHLGNNLRIFDTQGKLLSIQDIDQLETTIDITRLSSGIYHTDIIDRKGMIVDRGRQFIKVE